MSIAKKKNNDSSILTRDLFCYVRVYDVRSHREVILSHREACAQLDESPRLREGAGPSSSSSSAGGARGSSGTTESLVAILSERDALRSLVRTLEASHAGLAGLKRDVGAALRDTDALLRMASRLEQARGRPPQVGGIGSAGMPQSSQQVLPVMQQQQAMEYLDAVSNFGLSGLLMVRSSIFCLMYVYRPTHRTCFLLLPEGTTSSSP